jgi:hypothetical protein
MPGHGRGRTWLGYERRPAGSVQENVCERVGPDIAPHCHHAVYSRGLLGACMGKVAQSDAEADSQGGGGNARVIPDWITKRVPTSARRVRLREWEDPAWRSRSGWVGTDLCHNLGGHGVCILQYWWDEPTQELYGAVHFGPGCESHAGWCHGGSMTYVLCRASRCGVVLCRVGGER